jgi:hypothetical protein
MPILIDVIPEGGQLNFPSHSWHFCQHPHSVGSFGNIACAWPILDASGEQVILFYDDSEDQLIPRLKKDPNNPEERGIPRDPNSRYYPLPLLLPNHNICYYLVPESKQESENVIENWQNDLKQWQTSIKKWHSGGKPDDESPNFFVAVDSPFVFEDSLQIFFSDEVNMPKLVG